jgi:hypothetical protein
MNPDSFAVGLSAKARRPGPMVLTVWTDGGYGEVTETTTVLPCSDEVPLQIVPTRTALTAAVPTGITRWYVAAVVDGCSDVRSTIASFEATPSKKRRSAR